MTRIVHLSDLHFGALVPGLLAPLARQVKALSPDLIVVSGDLTQRARAGQFAQARAFLDGLGAPVLAVPGNHDLPLHRPLTRLLRPFHAWDRGWSPDREPAWQNDRVIVVGVNTADPCAWRRGVIRQAQLDRVAALLAGAGARVRIVVMHHPLEHPPGEDQPLMRGAAMALAALPRIGAQVVLSGHLHVSHAGPFSAAPGVLFLQAGTGLSHRRRAEPNTFNMLEVSAQAIAVQVILSDSGAAFRPRQDFALAAM